MIKDFIDSWPLFAESYLLGAALAIMLPLVGTMVVIRRQVFVSIAISQASMLGMAFGMLLQHAHHHGSDSNQWIIVLIFSLLASLLSLRVPGQNAEQREVSTVMVFTLSTTLAYLLLAHTPVGLKEIQERMSSSLISSSMTDVYTILVLSGALIIFWAKFKSHILWISIDPDSARAHGLSIFKWEFILCFIIGLSIGWAVYLCGWLYTFGNLILPVYIARRIAKTPSQVLIFAPSLAVVLNFLGFFAAHPLDIPFSQMAVAVLGAAFLLTPNMNKA